jgi:hypothetical protein
MAHTLIRVDSGGAAAYRVKDRLVRLHENFGIKKDFEVRTGKGKRY